MSRPPVLPLIDWESIFSGAKAWESWLDNAENAEWVSLVHERADSLVLPAQCRETLMALSRDVYVIGIAEDWGSDVSRHAPVVAEIEKATPYMHVRYISRMDHPDVLARFLTNGGEGVPKYVFFNSDFVEYGNWGPMQANCRDLVARGKAAGEPAAARAKVREIYAADPNCNAVFEELCALVELAGATTIV